jgi:hypothetical protein
VQNRFKEARDRAAERRRKRALENKQQQSGDMMEGGAGLVHGGTGSAGGTSSSLLLADTHTSGASGQGDLCFVEGGIEDGKQAPTPAAEAGAEDGAPHASWQRWSLLNATRDGGACLVARSLFATHLHRCLSHSDCLAQVSPPIHTQQKAPQEGEAGARGRASTGLACKGLYRAEAAPQHVAPKLAERKAV